MRGSTVAVYPPAPGKQMLLEQSTQKIGQFSRPSASHGTTDRGLRFVASGVLSDVAICFPAASRKVFIRLLCHASTPDGLSVSHEKRNVSFFLNHATFSSPCHQRVTPPLPPWTVARKAMLPAWGSVSVARRTIVPEWGLCVLARKASLPGGGPSATDLVWLGKPSSSGGRGSQVARKAVSPGRKCVWTG